ncbi:hypothetical protein [uncultured Eudoraea sp.]|uniref:hypothetical protein n=1 Tax=uncultured Eudoraea sp. TaxID=1035614 RepID=UPI00262DFA08|nr:hypothetical protein [uncultured Eudoraea sp.]
MKPKFYINVVKKLLSLAFLFSLSFVVSCTNDDSDNEDDLEIVTPGEGAVLDTSKDVKTDNTVGTN